jgi:hypothetical protein
MKIQISTPKNFKFFLRDYSRVSYRVVFVFLVLLISLVPELEILRYLLNSLSIVSLFFAIFLNHNRIRNLFYLLCFINLTFVFSKIILTNYIDSILFFILMIFLFSNIFNKSSLKNNLNHLVKMLLFLFLIYLISRVLLDNVAGLLSILGLGYDNSHHIGLFRYFAVTSDMATSSLTKYDLIPESLFSSYPDIFHIFFGSINRLIGFNDSTSQIIVSYVFSIFVLFICQLRGIINVILLLKKSNFTVVILGLFSFLFLATTQFSIMFISGYPHNLFGITILILSIWLIALVSQLIQRVAVVGLVLIPITYSTPQLLPVLLAIFVCLLLLFLKGRNITFKITSIKSLSFAKGFLTFSLLVLPLLFAIFGLSQIIGHFSLKQVYAEGGVEPFSTLFYIFYFITFCLLILFLFTFDFKLVTSKRRDLMILTIMSALTSQVISFTLAFLTFIRLEYVSYYALKSIYFSLPFIFLGMATVSLITNKKYSLWLSKFTLLFSILFLTSLSISGFYPKVYSGGFMSSLPIALTRFMDLETKGAQLIYGPQILSALKVISSEDRASVFIIASDIHGSDLNSRWLNALNGTFSDKNWSFFYNSSIDSINNNCKNSSRQQLIFADISSAYDSTLFNCISLQKVVPFSRKIIFNY